jgi:ATP phosphoribosyltransferase
VGRNRSEGAGAGRRDRRAHRDRLLPARQQPRIVDTILTSTTRLIATRRRGKTREAGKIEQLAMLLQGALAAESRVLLKLNVADDKLEAVSAILPSLHAPTINKLNDADWFAVESVVEEKVVRDIVPPLRAAGAEGIIELPLNKVIF